MRNTCILFFIRNKIIKFIKKITHVWKLYFSNCYWWCWSIRGHINIYSKNFFFHTCSMSKKIFKVFCVVLCILSASKMKKLNISWNTHKISKIELIFVTNSIRTVQLKNWTIWTYFASAEGPVKISRG